MAEVSKRLLLVGPGDLGMARARCLKRIAGAELVAVVSRTPQRAAAAAAELEVPLWGTDLEEVAERARPDAVVIAATNRAQDDLVTGALRRRFFQSPAGAASRYEVEAARIRRLPTPAPT